MLEYPYSGKPLLRLIVVKEFMSTKNIPPD
jgi:hypothetical protein